MKRSVTADRVQEIMVFGLLSFKCLFVVCFIFGMTYAGLSHDVRVVHSFMKNCLSVQCDSNAFFYVAGQ